MDYFYNNNIHIYACTCIYIYKYLYIKFTKMITEIISHGGVAMAIILVVMLKLSYNW